MYIGVDYGTKRVGVAVSDADGRMAFPLEVVARREALARIVDLVTTRGISEVVVGESKDLSGRENPIMVDVHAFVRALVEATGVEVTLEPEFYTSAQASRTGRGDNPRNARREAALAPSKLDASAATLILQHFLDRRASGTMPRMQHNNEELMATDTDVAPAVEAGTVTPVAVKNSEMEETAATYLTIDDFARVDIRIGEILSAEKVEKADKLLKLSVSFGHREVRQIVSGIALYFPDHGVLVGKHVAFVYNLKPRTIRGLESQGMIMAAGGEDGSVTLLEAPGAPAGSRIS